MKEPQSRTNATMMLQAACFPCMFNGPT